MRNSLVRLTCIILASSVLVSSPVFATTYTTTNLSTKHWWSGLFSKSTATKKKGSGKWKETKDVRPNSF